MERSRSARRPAIDPQALVAALGGFEVLEEDLRLEPAPGLGREDGAPRVARLAGVDGEGRALLVLAEDGEEAVLAAVDALAWCDAQGELLVRRFGADAALAPGVVLIVSEPEPLLLAALAALRAEDLRVFTARRVRGARGDFSELVEVSRAAAGTRAQPAAWDADLPEAARGFAAWIRAGMARIDEGLEPSTGPRGTIWRHGRGRLVALRASARGLEADIEGRRMPIADAEDVERLLALALRGYLADGELLRGPDPAQLPPAADRAPAAAPVPLLPSGPLLSEDELAALRGELD
ncbi:MAG: hypothetical protein JNK02_16025 [Planctomycetes bacterium]|nr:hypothetical protein [Planctomycetota bacterium]